MDEPRFDAGAGGTAAAAVGYARRVDGVLVELVGDDTRVAAYRDGRPWLRFPRGWRVVTDRSGCLLRVVGMSPTAVAGSLEVLTGRGAHLELSLAGNEEVLLDGVTVASRRTIGVVAPTF